MLMSSPKYKLTYFNVRALGEPIRWQFLYTSTPFDDERIPMDYPKWFGETKQKYSSTIGMLPVLTEDGKTELSQAQAISRYLANEFGLVGDTNWENAKADEMIGLVSELFFAWRSQVFEPDAEKKAANKGPIEQKFRQYYSKFNSLLKESSGDYVAGKKLTHADFWLASHLNVWDEPVGQPDVVPIMLPGMPMPSLDDLFIDLTKEFPALRQFKERITSIPQIKNWIQKRPKTVA